MQNAMVRVMDPTAALDDGELQGEEGQIDILRFKDASEEASHLADAISGWINNDAMEPSEIAVLVSKQQHLYCQELRAALRAREVPFREEDQAQDLASEPVVRLITDFLLVVSGTPQPEAYRRWTPSFTAKHSTTNRNTVLAPGGSGSLPTFASAFQPRS
jgi:superfamily I DNA/RNA helicase